MPRPAALLMPLLALGAAACVAPYDPYVAAPAYVAPAPYTASPYATPMPRYVGEGEILRGERRGYAGPAYAAAPMADPYCREAYANAAGAERQAAISGTYEDAARAARTEGFYRRDC